MPPSKKICALDRLLSLRQQARDAGKTVVHCHGCFDIVHPGHIMHLQFARSLGDILVVSVSADSQVNKGADRPLIPDDLRAASLAALECVDWVYVNPDSTAVELLCNLKPDVYVKGKEYEKNFDLRFQAERGVVEQFGGRVVYSSGEVVYSSTALIGSLGQKEAFDDEKVLRFRDRYDLHPANLRRLLNGFGGQKVVVVGDYLLDRYHFCDATGVAREGPMMALRHLQEKDFDGGAAVIARHLQGLGAEATLVTALADDEASRQCELRLRGQGIGVQAVRSLRQTIVKNRYLVDQTKLFKVDQGTGAAADSRNEQTVSEMILAAAQDAAAVIFADFGYGVISGGLLDKVMKPLRSAVPIIAADVSGRQSNLLRFRDVDLLCPTEREVRETLHDFSNGLGFVIWNLLQTTSARQAIITLGKQGLVTFDRAAGEEVSSRLRSEYLPALSTVSVDPLGCGDALLAAATLTLSAGGSLQAAAFIGSMAAAMEVRLIGNEPVTAGSLSSWLFDREAAAEAA
ncbi:MAG TPA: PfkB family carbohydrate kinase [Tepidisphaeraceae bacterium]|nr:PfkB family carbohydrate kinase [Tepidisphaeraceae bacterium]